MNNKVHTRSLIRLIEETVGEPSLGVEVGLWRGENAVALLRRFPTLHLIGVDAWDAELSRRTMRKSQDVLDAVMEECLASLSPFFPRVTVVRSESVLATAAVSDGYAGFVFVDGCHAYESVKGDLEAWWPKVRAGGLFAGHDYGGMGDRQGRFGVRRAVDEFAERIGREVSVRRGHVWAIVK